MRDEPGIIRLAMEGDERAFNELFETYKDYSFKIAWFILHDRDDCLDCLNNAWLKIHSALLRKSFAFKSRFSTWIYTIVTNEAVVSRRFASRTVSLDDPFLKDSLTALHPDDLTMEEKAAKKVRIEKVMRKLSPIQQEIVTLLLDNYTFPEIARKLNVKPNHLYQLNSRIKEILEN